jgi:hypothetical protein
MKLPPFERSAVSYQLSAKNEDRVLLMADR